MRFSSISTNFHKGSDMNFRSRSRWMVIAAVIKPKGRPKKGENELK